MKGSSASDWLQPKLLGGKSLPRFAAKRGGLFFPYTIPLTVPARGGVESMAAGEGEQRPSPQPQSRQPTLARTDRRMTRLGTVQASQSQGNQEVTALCIPLVWLRPRCPALAEAMTRAALRTRFLSGCSVQPGNQQVKIAPIHPDFPKRVALGALTGKTNDAFIGRKA